MPAVRASARGPPGTLTPAPTQSPAEAGVSSPDNTPDIIMVEEVLEFWKLGRLSLAW